MSEDVDTTANSTPEESPTAVRDILERALLVGLGAAALTKDRVQAVADEFIRRGQLSADEGKDLVEGLAARSRDEARSVLRGADSSLQSVMGQLGVATQRSVEDVEFRVQQLEHRLALLERQADAASTVDE